MTNDKFDNVIERSQDDSTNDPRMTAYLLDELNSTEKAQWEQMLRDDPSLQASTAAMRQTIELVRATLRNEPVEPGSVPVSTDEATTPSETDYPRVAGISYRRVFGSLLALGTACLVVAFAFFLPAGVGKIGCSSHSGQLARQKRERVLVERETLDAGVAHNKTLTKESIDGNATHDVADDSKNNSKKSEVMMSDRVVPATAADRSLADSSKISQAPAMGEDIVASGLGGDTAFGGMAGSMERVESLAEKALPQKPASPPPAVTPAPSSSVVKRKSRIDSNSIVAKENEAFESNRRSNFARSNVKSDRDGAELTGLKREAISQPVASEQRDIRGRRGEYRAPSGGEGYSTIKENPFVTPKEEPFSTFSIDVDTASYTNVRRFLDMGQLPPPHAVKIEELVNYFKYDYTGPAADAKEPFASAVAIAACPWEKEHLLVRIAIKGKEIPKAKRPPLNLVFLIDISGSMSSPNKLPLVKRALEELVGELDKRDRVAIVTYAGSSRVHLETTNGSKSDAILRSIDQLSAGGSTAGADGIRTAYEIAISQYDKEAANRVILCTDGDFNVGTTDNKELENLIAQKAKSGVFLSILGFGMGNYKDDRLATLSNRGNGNYGYIDDMSEARRLLVDGLTGTLVTIAKDVKIQIDFNPGQVAAWRLIGYEDRKLATEDFHNDRKDAGDIGAGHNVTALYEIVPVGVDSGWSKRVDESRYAVKKDDKKAEQPKKEPTDEKNKFANELMFVKLRYKLPEADKSTLVTFPVTNAPGKGAEETSEFEFAAAVALFGMLLRDSQYSADGSWDLVLKLARGDKDAQLVPERADFISLVKKAKRLSGK